MNTTYSFSNNYAGSTSLTCNEMLKYVIYGEVITDPLAFSIHVSLATHYDGFSRTGVINPHADRLLHYHQLSEPELVSGVARLLKSGLWQVPVDEASRTGHFANGLILWEKMTLAEIEATLTSFGIRNVTEFIPTFMEDALSKKTSLKKYRVSNDHVKHNVRYSRMKAGLPTAIAILASAKMKSVFNDLGYKRAVQGKRKPPHTYFTGSKHRKIFHNTWFDHPLMRSSSAADLQTLANITVLTPEMVAKPSVSTLTFEAITRKFNLDAETAADEIMLAVQDIREAGKFAVMVECSPFADSRMETLLTFTPTLELHQAVWDTEMRSDGASITRWERENGHHPDNDRGTASGSANKDFSAYSDPSVALNSYPPLGYHYLYVLRRKKTNEIFWVGETTTELSLRLARHKRTMRKPGQATDYFNAILQDPTDAITVDCIGLIHNYAISRFEMHALRLLKQAGFPMVNYVSGASNNDRSIHPDSRYSDWHGSVRKNHMDRMLRTKGEVVFYKALALTTEQPQNA